MACIFEMSCPPCGKMATIEMLTMLFWKSLISGGGGGEGSPSEMMIMCLADASLFCRPFRPNCIVLVKLGMSPMTAALIFLNSSWYSPARVSLKIQSSPAGV